MKNLLAFILVAVATSAHAEVKLPALFSDHMVLQCNAPLTVWGWASPGEEVTALIADQSVRATAGQDGKWALKLAPLKAADSIGLTVKGDTNTLNVADVAVGEVWLGSGQSNMSWPLAKDEAATVVPDAGLRFFRVKTARSVDRQDDVDGAWVVVAKGKLPPGVPYFFIRDVRAHTKVPVGVIVSNVGGTRVSEWVDPQVLADEPALKVIAQRDAEARLKYRESQKNIDPNTTPPDKAKLPEVYGRLYSAMIAPLQPYAIRGVIWYQGEDDKGNKNYQPLFTALINGWRKAWGQGDFPFLFVQIAPDTGNDPFIRDVQRRVWSSVINTAMVVTVDGEVSRHPTHKEAPGTRLALVARVLAYGDKTAVYSGPAYDGLTIDGNKAVLSFTHVGGGLVAKDGELIGFTIAGEDRQFLPAVAKIIGDTVVVTHDAVPKPVAVRYGWDAVPKVNLFSQNGLPASPFRTDDWAILKEKQ